jgi:hypothetical protein
MSEKAKSWREYKAFMESKRELAEKPEKILYVNMMVEMNTGRILPTVIPFEKLPIEVKIFFKEVLLQAQKNNE